jgi:hypothetical protein
LSNDIKKMVARWEHEEGKAYEGGPQMAEVWEAETSHLA